jgi:branched-chain amino acid transport system ATP-binding protein
VISLIARIPEAGYGKKVVLRNISLHVSEGEIVAIIGPNGAGKSTLLKVLIGLLPIPRGSILLDGTDLTNGPPERNTRAGISFAPQGNRVFAELTVKENLEIGGYLLKDSKVIAARIEQVLALFPDLRERLKLDALKLSGGEKQQLALARALMLQPRVLLMDEPSLGLSPNLVAKALDTIVEVNRTFKTTIIVVEQKVREVLRIAQRVYALRLGGIVFEGTPQELQEGDRLQKI